MTHLERLSETRHEQRAAPQLAQPEVVGVLPVVAGDTIPLPFDPQGLLARLDSNGNLAIRSGARTYILQNYVAADLRENVTILADDGSEIDLPLVIAATGPEVVFPTAAGFGGTPPGNTIGGNTIGGNGIGGNGIFEPFSDPEAVGTLAAAGALESTDISAGEAPIPLRSSPEPDTTQETTESGAVPPGNSAPTASDIKVSAAEDDGPVEAAFSATDPDPADQGELAFTILTQPAQGTLKNNGDGTFAYDPGPGFQELAEGQITKETFTYQATDPQGAASNVATVIITITGVNDAPTADPVSVALSEDDPSATGKFLGDDPDSDDDPTTLTYTITTPLPAGQGTLENHKDGTFTFVPGEDFNHLAVGETAEVTFKYTATDFHGAISPEAEVTITVTGVNDPPVATSLSIETTEDGPPVTVSGVADDPDSDDDSASLEYKLAIPVPRDQGTVIEDSDGIFTFDPGDHFQHLSDGESQELAFAYTVTDRHGATSDIAIVTVTVNGVNDAPTAQSLDFSTTEDGPVLLEALAGEDIDNDDNSETLTYILGPLSGKGALKDHGKGIFSFDPGTDFEHLKAGESEIVTFTYQAEDKHDAQSDTATVTITVTGVDDAPVANPLTVAAKEDGGPVTEFYDATDADDNASTLAFVILDQPSEGAIKDNDDGTFTFDPGAGFQSLAEGKTVEITFTYQATDLSGNASNVATGTITVTGVNDPPVVAPITMSAVRGGGDVTTAFDGTDIDGDSLKYQFTTNPAEGTIDNNGDGTFSYTPNATGSSTTITVNYLAINSHDAVSQEGVITIEIVSLNTAPVAENLKLATDEDSGLAGKLPVTDAEDVPENLAYDILTQPTAGKLTLLKDGAFLYDPLDDFQELAAGESATVTFTYQATDPGGLASNIATVEIVIAGVNDAPTAEPVTIAAFEDGPTVTGDFLGDDIDDDPGKLAFAIVTPPAEGTLVNNNDGSFTFTPGVGFQDLALGETRIVTFTYKAIDGEGVASDPATGTITVTGKNDAPTAASLALTVQEGAASEATNFLGDDIDSDDDRDSLTYQLKQPPSGGTVILDAVDGTFIFDPGDDFDFLLKGQTQTVTFTYQATDRHGAASAPATVTVTVEGANVAPDSDECPIPPDNILAAYTYVGGTKSNDTLGGSNNNLWFQGFAGNDTLNGADRADLLEGGDGNDSLTGGNGADIILGGDGSDTISSGDDLDCVDAGAGNDTVDGGNSNDDLHGDEGNDSLRGGDGDDELEGGVGNDKLFGDQSQDSLIGGDGDDTLSGGDGDDTVNGGIGNDVLTGEQGQDVLTAGDGNDTLDGGEGDDKLDGAAGNDSLLGGNGQDKLDSGVGDDRVAGGNGDDSITGGDGNDLLSGEEGNDAIDGGKGSDTIFGGNGDDKLTGGDGNDTIEGGAGHDTIDGKSGNVTVRFADLLDAGDQIDNFGGGQDIIDLDPLFDALEATLGPLNAETRESMIQINPGGGSAQLSIDTDLGPGTSLILLATIATSDPLAIGTTIIVNSP